MPDATIDDLRSVPTFQELPEEVLQWLLDKCTFTLLQPGEYLFAKDQPTMHMHIILDGKIEIYFEQNGQRQVISHLERGAITGMLPYSRMKAAAAYGLAVL